MRTALVKMSSPASEVILDRVMEVSRTCTWILDMMLPGTWFHWEGNSFCAWIPTPFSSVFWVHHCVVKDILNHLTGMCVSSVQLFLCTWNRAALVLALQEFVSEERVSVDTSRLASMFFQMIVSTCLSCEVGHPTLRLGFLICKTEPKSSFNIQKGVNVTLPLSRMSPISWKAEL